jgi:hypothetical protein
LHDSPQSNQLEEHRAARWIAQRLGQLGWIEKVIV